MLYKYIVDITLLAIPIAIAAYLYWQRKNFIQSNSEKNYSKQIQEQSDKANFVLPPNINNSPHFAVKIYYPKYEKHCTQVARLGGKTFYPNDAPMLPLLDCDVANCNCKYIALDDRRQVNRRELAERRKYPRSEDFTNPRRKEERRKEYIANSRDDGQ